MFVRVLRSPKYEGSLYVGHPVDEARALGCTQQAWDAGTYDDDDDDGDQRAS